MQQAPQSGKSLRCFEMKDHGGGLDEFESLTLNSLTQIAEQKSFIGLKFQNLQKYVIEKNEASKNNDNTYNASERGQAITAADGV